MNTDYSERKEGLFTLPNQDMELQYVNNILDCFGIPPNNRWQVLDGKKKDCVDLRKESFKKILEIASQTPVLFFVYARGHGSTRSNM